MIIIATGSVGSIHSVSGAACCSVPMLSQTDSSIVSSILDVWTSFNIIYERNNRLIKALFTQVT